MNVLLVIEKITRKKKKGIDILISNLHIMCKLYIIHIKEIKMEKIYRGNTNINVEERNHNNEGTYRGVKHNNTVEKYEINRDELKYRGA